MRARRPAYTDYPRPILWLVPGGWSEVDGEAVEIAPFYLSKWPVTNEQYRAFDPAFRPAEVSPGPRDVAVGISWERAQAYCEWYAEVARKPMRLPTEAEWLHACRGVTAEGDGAGESAGLHGIGGLDPRLGRDFDRVNDHGLHGMTGGVWEWTATGDGDVRAMCGGSFRTPEPELGCDLRRTAPVDHRADDVGFRVAKSLR